MELIIFWYFGIFKKKRLKMEIITHLINDTVEFYKWSLTIAGDFLYWVPLEPLVSLNLICFHFGYQIIK